MKMLVSCSPIIFYNYQTNIIIELSKLREISPLLSVVILKEKCLFLGIEIDTLRLALLQRVMKGKSIIHLPCNVLL